MKLAHLLSALNIPASQWPEGAANCVISGVTADSRAVAKDFLFIAVPGVRADGMLFAEMAVEKGAVIVMGERAPDVQIKVPFIKIADARAVLSGAAALLYPRQPAIIAAVTGTSGKTSVAAFTRQIWAHLGLQAAALGTTGVVKPSGATYGSLTTPDPVTLHRTLDELAGEGVTHLAMEASSHGLDQRRLDGVRLTSAGFTNLSRDHLDYHPTIEAYLAAKMRLFDTLLQPGQSAVLNADCDVAEHVAAVMTKRGLKIFSIGHKGRDLTLISAEADKGGYQLHLRYADQSMCVHLPLAGDFMISNALVAAGLCITSGADAPKVLAALAHLQGAPGRLEQVGDKAGAPIFVDYAHKPDALDKVLATLRPLASGKLIVVFGCGGDRDQGKRPLMGAIASAQADVVIVTDDNPRSEEPAKIRAAILAQAPGALEIGDRAAAIRHAISLLQKGDVLVIAGKGHETGQIIGTKTMPFSDHDAVHVALAECAA